MSRLVQTVIRVVSVEHPTVSIVIPGWSSVKVVRISIASFPVDIRPKLAPDFRLWADVNLGADYASDLNIKNFRLVP